MKKLIFALILLSSFHFCWSQTPDQPKKIKIKAIGNLGFVEGEMGPAFQIQLISAAQIKSWSIGLGTGLDYYQMRSIPLFIDLRKEILKKPKTPFIYADGGLNFPWKTNRYHQITKVESGFFYDLGIGFKFPVGSNAILVSGGYSFKSYSHEEDYHVWCFMPPCPVQTEKFDYKYRRVSVKAGFMF